MKEMIRVASELLRRQGYTCTEQDLKRAYWRQAKRRGGNCGHAAANYLILNKIAKKAPVAN